MRILILLAAFFISLPLALGAYKEGPFPNVTGGFGDQTCHACHLDNPVNAPGGSLAVAGVPATYIAGRAYAMTVTLSRDGMERSGFEIAARFASGKLRGTQAGSWRLLDNRVQMIPSQVDPALRFVQHNLAGSKPPAVGRNSWIVEWTAPSPPAGIVQFNVAGNATNNDDSPLGDFIYTKTVRSRPAASSRSPVRRQADRTRIAAVACSIEKFSATQEGAAPPHRLPSWRNP